MFRCSLWQWVFLTDIDTFHLDERNKKKKHDNGKADKNEVRRKYNYGRLVSLRKEGEEPE